MAGSGGEQEARRGRGRKVAGMRITAIREVTGPDIPIRRPVRPFRRLDDKLRRDPYGCAEGWKTAGRLRLRVSRALWPRRASYGSGFAPRLLAADPEALSGGWRRPGPEEGMVGHDGRGEAGGPWGALRRGGHARHGALGSGSEGTVASAMGVAGPGRRVGAPASPCMPREATATRTAISGVCGTRCPVTVRPRSFPGQDEDRVGAARRRPSAGGGGARILPGRDARRRRDECLRAVRGSAGGGSSIEFPSLVGRGYLRSARLRHPGLGGRRRRLGRSPPGKRCSREAEALLLAAHGGLRPGRDRLLFDPGALLRAARLPGHRRRNGAARLGSQVVLAARAATCSRCTCLPASASAGRSATRVLSCRSARSRQALCRWMAQWRPARLPALGLKPSIPWKTF